MESGCGQVVRYVGVMDLGLIVARLERLEARLSPPSPMSTTTIIDSTPYYLVTVDYA